MSRPALPIRVFHVWAAFGYHIPVGTLTGLVARILIHHADTPKQLDYTVRRTFAVDRSAVRFLGDSARLLRSPGGPTAAYIAAGEYVVSGRSATDSTRSVRLRL